MGDMVSVIVPVYNTERYLESCLRSILNQTYPAFEVILVDDGSTDGSPAICDSFACDRVRVFHQKNAGVSHARNIGVEAAKGDYIAFVDSDDIVHPKYLEVMMNGFRENCGISLCVHRRFCSDSELFFDAEPIQEGSMISSMEAMGLLNECPIPEGLAHVTPCAKIYRRSIFDKVRFPEGTRHEDEYIAHLVLKETEAVVQNPSQLYYYREHEDSYMGSIRQMKDAAHLVLFDALSKRVDFYQEHAPSLVEGAVHHILRESGSFYLDYTQRNDPVYRKKRSWLVKMYRSVYFRHFTALSASEKVKGMLFILCPLGYAELGERKRVYKESRNG